MIKFSVITVTYQASKVCQKTFESVFIQTYPWIEHLVIDGQSDDGTVEMAIRYQEKCWQQGESFHHEVTMLSEPDNGLYDAMNKGLERATGTYVIFMNAGDTFASPETLAEIVAKGRLCELEASHKTLPAVLYGDTDIYDDNGEYIGPRHLSVPERLSWRSFKNGMLVCHQAFYARTDIAKRTPFNLKYRYSADVDWCINIMKAAERKSLPMVNVHQVVAHYLREGQTTLHHRDSLKERFSVMKQHYGLLTTLFQHMKFALRNLR